MARALNAADYRKSMDRRQAKKASTEHCNVQILMTFLPATFIKLSRLDCRLRYGGSSLQDAKTNKQLVGGAILDASLVLAHLMTALV